MKLKQSLFALPLAAGLAFAAPAAAQTVVGVTATEIKIGNINPYSGPASAYGTDVLRARLRARGLRRCAEFTWERSAQGVLEACRAAAGARG